MTNIVRYLWIPHVCLSLAVFASSSERADAAERPNIILIMTDDQGWWDLGVHGNKKIDTPSMDRIAREGVRFSRFYVQPVCGPTRCGLMTGRYFARTGFWENRFGGDTIRPSEVTLGEVLQQAGYRTGIFGKWHLGIHGDSRPNAQGFEEALTFLYGHIERYNFADQLKFNGEPVETRGYITDLLTNAALEFIAAADERPFFCYLPYNAPHEPFKAGNGAVDLREPGDKLIEKYLDRGLGLRDARIYAMIERCDTNIGRLLDSLEEQKIANNTIVLFMSDNGGLSTHYRAGLHGGKASVSEGGILAPLFVRWPGNFPANKTVDAVASHIDILPTICELVDAPLPRDRVIDGKSIAGLMRAGTGESPHEYLYRTWVRHGPHPDRNWAILSGKFKLVNGKLFAIETDRGETQNIAKQHPEVVKRLRAEYLRWYQEVTEDLVYEPVPIEVGRTDENPVQLDPAWARCEGDAIRFYFRGYDWDTIEGWRQPGEVARWKIDVVKPGRYAVQLSYGADRRSRGSKLRISAGDSSLDYSIESTPTAEVFIRRDAGELTIDKSTKLITAEAIEVRGDELMRLNSIQLRRLPDAEEAAE